MRSDGVVEIQYYVSPDDKEKIEQVAKGNLSAFTRRAVAFYLEHGLNEQPISVKSGKQGGRREGAGRKPKTRTA